METNKPNHKTIILKYKNLVIRPLALDDLKLRVKWYNDPEIRETLILDKPLEIEKTIEWFNTVENSNTRLDMIISTVRDGPIGAIGLREIDVKARTAGIYMVLGDKSCWGKGIMYDAHLCLLNFVFNDLRLDGIWANVLGNNIASYVTLKKIGFLREKILEKEFIRDGQYYDVFRMSIFRDTFCRKHHELSEYKDK